MPDIPNRDELERKLSRALGRLNKRQLAALLEYLGDPPNFNNVPPEFWDKAGKELAEVVIPFSEGVYIDAAARMLEEVTIGVDWNLVNEAASRWAGQYGFELVTGINNTSRQAIQRAVTSYFNEGLTQGQLRERLGRIYSPVRAEMIARTEVTRAAVQGERDFVGQIERQGYSMVEVWHTRADEIVCPICSPRNDKKRGDGWDSDHEPPAHPRCRCWIGYEVVFDEGVQ